MSHDLGFEITRSAYDRAHHLLGLLVGVCVNANLSVSSADWPAFVAAARAEVFHAYRSSGGNPIVYAHPQLRRPDGTTVPVWISTYAPPARWVVIPDAAEAGNRYKFNVNIIDDRGHNT